MRIPGAIAPSTQWIGRSNGRPRKGRGVDALRLAYLSSIAAVTCVVAAVVPRDLIPTLVGVTVGWAVVSAALLVGWRSAGHGLVLAVTIALVWRNYAELSLQSRTAGVVALGVTLLGLRAVPLRATRAFPFLAIYCSLQALYLYVSVLIARPSPLNQPVYPDEIRGRGFLWLAVFMAILVATSYLLQRVVVGVETERPPRSVDLAPWAAPRALVLILATSFLSALLTALDVADRLGSLTEVPRLLGFAGLAALFLMWLRGQLALRYQLATVGVVGLLVLLGLGTGALYQAAYPGIILFIIIVAERRRVPWVPLLLVALAMVLLNVGKGEYRLDATAGLVERGGTEGGIAYLAYTGSVLAEATEEDLSYSAHRFSNSDLLGYFATWTPDRYPWYGAGIYRDIAVVLVPRVILPDKQTFPTANIIGREYELLSRSDYETAMNTPLAAEAYVSGGPAYLVVIALMSGMFLFGMGRLFGSDRPAVLLAAAVVCLTALSAIESGIYFFVLLLPFGGVTYLGLRLFLPTQAADALETDVPGPVDGAPRWERFGGRTVGRTA